MKEFRPHTIPTPSDMDSTVRSWSARFTILSVPVSLKFSLKMMNDFVQDDKNNKESGFIKTVKKVGAYKQ
jgi:hypothetical protein